MASAELSDGTSLRKANGLPYGRCGMRSSALMGGFYFFYLYLFFR
jgi:hypothetical protein